MSFSCVDSVFRLVISVGQRKKNSDSPRFDSLYSLYGPNFFSLPQARNKTKKTCSSKCNQPDPSYVADNSMTFISPE